MKYLTRLSEKKSGQKVALTSSIVVIQVYSYNEYMNRSQDDINVIKKVNMIVQDRFPEFAYRYFRENMNIKTPRSLYAYAIDLTSFFEYLEYLETDSFDTKRMLISDLNRITSSIIEDYLYFSRNYSDKGKKKIRSDAAIKRRYCSLSSFLEFYYKKGMIDQNPAKRITPPRQNIQVSLIPSVKMNRNIIDFISNGSLKGRKAAFQAKTCIRDAAIVMLLASTGIKVSELVELNIEDIHLDELYLTVKGRKSQRTIYISESTAQALGRYLSIRLDTIAEYGHDDALSLSLKSKKLCIRSVEYMIKKYSEAIMDENEHLTPESMHKSFRNNIFIQSMNVPATSDICGLDQETLMLYYRPYIDDYECEKGKEFNI